MEYRKACENDLEELSAMRVLMLEEEGHNDCDFKKKLYAKTFEYLREGLRDDSVSLWIATDNNETVAMCCLNYFHLPPNELSLSGKSAHLGNMYTIPCYRKNGIAMRLLELAAAEAKTNQCDRIVLVPSNAGKPLYKKFGFQPWFDAMVFFPT